MFPSWAWPPTRPLSASGAVLVVVYWCCLAGCLMEATGAMVSSNAHSEHRPRLQTLPPMVKKATGTMRKKRMKRLVLSCTQGVCH
uniref:Putative secreted protein n=1 Tax=Anopheles darlingi TaxID=43151 RepID=A0A2M4DS77_ANODA